MEEQMTNNHTKKEARGIGDNAETPSEYLNKQVAYCYDALTTAVKYITRLTVSNEKLKNKLEEVGQCKNNWDRSLVEINATKINAKIIKDVKPFEEILSAIDTRQDIHSGDLKTKKLELCNIAGNFGNFIANNAGGEFDKDISKTFQDAVLDKEFSDED